MQIAIPHLQWWGRSISSYCWRACKQVQRRVHEPKMHKQACRWYIFVTHVKTYSKRGWIISSLWFQILIYIRSVFAIWLWLVNGSKWKEAFYTYHVSIVHRQHLEVAVEMLLILPYPSHRSMSKNETIRGSETEAFSYAVEIIRFCQQYQNDKYKEFRGPRMWKQAWNPYNSYQKRNRNLLHFSLLSLESQ